MELLSDKPVAVGAVVMERLAGALAEVMVVLARVERVMIAEEVPDTLHGP